MCQVIINDTKDQTLFKKIIQDFVNDPENEKKHKAYLENSDAASHNLALHYCHFWALKNIEMWATINRIDKREPAYTFSNNDASANVIPVLKQYVDKPGWEQLRQEIIDLCWKIGRYRM